MHYSGLAETDQLRLSCVSPPTLDRNLTEQFRHSQALVCEDVITLGEVRITGVDWTLRSEAKAIIEQC